MSAPETGNIAAGFCDLGLLPYERAHALQIELAAQRHRGILTCDLFLTVEHPPVFTLGRRGGREHLGVSETFLADRNIALVPIERGGDITFHGPGQLVLYPIFSLRRARMSVSDYVFRLEELMRLVAADFGVQAVRDDRNRGIWVGNNKLGSIGIAIRHGIAFHGLALNVNLDLEPFGWINPCGLLGIGMTTLAKERGSACSMDAVRTRLQQHLAQIFSVHLHSLTAAQIPAISSSLEPLS